MHDFPRAILLLGGLIPYAAGNGAGVWADSKLFTGGLAGLRFVSEGPPHVLQLVGTDDGKTWYARQGTCSGPKMSVITFGSGQLAHGAFTRLADDSQSVQWPGGTVWNSVAQPPAALLLPDGVDDHVGVFRDPNHWRAARCTTESLQGCFAGLRMVAEDPPHQLKVVGSDDGHKWWSVNGSCSGPGMTVITLDFSAKAPSVGKLVGSWASADARHARTAQISWPDSNAWSKEVAPAAAAGRLAASPRGAVLSRASSIGPTLLLLVGGAVAAAVYMRRRALAARLRESEPARDERHWVQRLDEEEDTLSGLSLNPRA